MKKTLSVFLAVIMLMSVLVSCSTKKEDGDDTTNNGQNDPLAEIWASHSYDKLRTDSRKAGADNDYTVYLAKNETEGLHIGFRPEENMVVRFKAISGENEHISWRVYHVREILTVGRKKYTDPCVSFARLGVKGGETSVFLLEFTTSPNTPKGDYEYEFAFTDSKGNVYASLTTTVHVWDFAMPEQYTFETAVGLMNDSSKNAQELMLEHNMSPYIKNFDILSDEADAYMSDPRVTSFRVEDRVDDETLVRYYEKLKTNPEWLKKAFFYVHGLDEPNVKNGRLDLFEETYSRLRRLCPGVRIICPFFENDQVTPELDQIDFMSQYIDLHCPKLNMWDEDQIYSAEQMEKYDSFDERMEALQERGDTVWSYVCNVPTAPYFNVQVLDEGLHSRVLFWQMYQRNVEGFLYWAADAWTEDPWNDIDSFDSGWHGDGIMMYPSEAVNGAPSASIRLKLMRDGVDDVELLYMAEELFGREWVDAKVNSVTTSLTSIEVTNDEFAALRIEIAEAIEAELSK